MKLQLRAVNNEASLTDQQVEYHFQSIDEYSLAIDRNSNNMDAYFGRAMDFMVLQDLTEAIDDFSKVISLNPDFLMAYFNRAVVRLKQMEIENYSSRDNNETNSMTLNLQTNQSRYPQTSTNPYSRTPVENTPQRSVDNKRMFDYEQILMDYATIIELNPDFVYAYFNRGNLRCLQKDFRTALLDYNEAIKRNPDFADAYYNRGLTRLSLGDTNGGITDLSKAGELGIADAYSIIKKMTTD
ncbi:hypothetical protein FACS189432_01250 [Bacteroidia bacterium]|nr:hypothetical protein FACS189432_01250 [Bacteroidia bacterium]